jgi:hypothetical protein
LRGKDDVGVSAGSMLQARSDGGMSSLVDEENSSRNMRKFVIESDKLASYLPKLRDPSWFPVLIPRIAV